MIKQRNDIILFFLNTLKWIILGSVVGILTGCVSALFLKLLYFWINKFNQLSFFYLLLPLMLFLSALIVKLFAPEEEGQGSDKIIKAVHKHSGKLSPYVVFVKLISTIITIAVGGSAGKEGPCAQIGAGLSSGFADIFKLNNSDRKKLVICGIGAGFATALGTPVAGALFGMEVIFANKLIYSTILPSIISSVIACKITSIWGIKYFYHNVQVDVFNFKFFIAVIMSACFFSLCSNIFIEIFKLGKNISSKINIWLPFKGLIGGITLILLTLLFSKQCLGLGLETIKLCVQGEEVSAYSFLLKPIFTSITLNFGGSGGIIVPILFTGATAGNFFASIFNLNISLFSALGFVALLAGTCNTPLTAIAIAVELFGWQITLYAVTVCIISFFISGKKSIFDFQVFSKSNAYFSISEK